MTEDEKKIKRTEREVKKSQLPDKREEKHSKWKVDNVKKTSHSNTRIRRVSGHRPK